MAVVREVIIDETFSMAFCRTLNHISLNIKKPGTTHPLDACVKDVRDAGLLLGKKNSQTIDVCIFGYCASGECIGRLLS